MIKNGHRMMTTTTTATLLHLALALAVCAMLMGSEVHGLPYRDLGVRTDGDDNGGAGELAPLARQVDVWRALLRDSDALDSYLSEEEEALRHLARMERRRRILAQQNMIRQPTDLRAKRRGSCLFGAGLSHNCDFRDVVGAVNEASHWGSEIAPGRK